jgi:hypothetical protein
LLQELLGLASRRVQCALRFGVRCIALRCYEALGASHREEVSRACADQHENNH